MWTTFLQQKTLRARLLFLDFLVFKAINCNKEYCEEYWQAYQSINLNITIKFYPRKLYESTNIYSRRILILGKVILVILHELLGHYMRRYYSYMTHGAIAFDTSNDKILDTGEEGGFFVEKIFLGLNKSDKSKLTISESLILFYLDNFKDYPIKKK